MSGCDQVTCFELFTSTPIRSPRGCVVPMQVQLHLEVAPYAFFSLVGELEIEVFLPHQHRGSSMGIGPNGSQEDPIMANFDRKSRKMNARTIIIIALHASILLLVCIGAPSFLKDARSMEDHQLSLVLHIHHPSIRDLASGCSQRSVESHLHGADKKTRNLDWNARMKIAPGSARGLVYLHKDSNPRVIHRILRLAAFSFKMHLPQRFQILAWQGKRRKKIIKFLLECAMTAHLLVKSDVYSYGVVLLELLTRKKPVDMSQPQGEENLVTWARPLLSSREGLEKVVVGNFDFDNIAKVAAIASMCVHPEVTQPFMGEVVQAIKLIYNDIEETCEDFSSQIESSESEFKGVIWGEGTPCLKYGYTSSFITMEYSSGPLEDMENRPLSPWGLDWGGRSLAAKHINRSGPFRTTRKPAFYRLRRGSMSEHGGLPSSRV
ncbi:hypothetical protein GIB67_022555 [Kingdonia uniflora]|uniref:Receptor-like PK ALE2 N-terminal domain-containing protein n=1 Tax=Kingdonia uniflora TaxID=39325 RepID=A0A7J7L7B7_9MAGN|nr:hypothetical protein GIB67_022555 [Kingdonia uniflora]